MRHGAGGYGSMAEARPPRPAKAQSRQSTKVTMFLALREIRRSRVRFGLLMAAVGLLVFLILVQQALQDGLITSFVGALERQSAPVLVYSVDGQRTLQGSVVAPPLGQAVRAVPEVAEAGRIGQGTFTVEIGEDGSAGGADEDGEDGSAGGADEDGDDGSDAALIGYETAALGAPDELSAGRLPRTEGEAVGSSADFSLGDRVRVVAQPAGPELTVVGLADEAQIQVTPTLFVAWSDYEAAARAANPDAEAILPNAIGVRPVEGVTAQELTARVNEADEEADALTRDEAAAEAPGVAEVRQSFQVIFLLFALVAPLVTGLFFLIVTFQKASALTLLRAIGAPAGMLVRSLLVQVVIVIGGGVVFGTALYAPLSQTEVGTLALRFDVGAVAFWAVLLLALGLASALVAARRVLAIDPMEATTGGGIR
jgi:putative ABC transport system permease protein